MAMIGSPQTDHHRILRRLDFPQSAKEALAALGIHLICIKLYVNLSNCTLIEQLCLPLAHTRPPTSKQLDYIGEIIDEFVFCEIDHKGAKRKVPNVLLLFFLSCLQFVSLEIEPTSRTATFRSVVGIFCYRRR